MNYNTAVELLSFVLLVSAFLIYLTANFKDWKIRGVNGPLPVPVFGNFVRVLFGRTSIESYLKNVYDTYSKESMVGLFTGSDPVLMVKDRDLIKDVLVKDATMFTNDNSTESEGPGAFDANVFSVAPGKWCELGNKISTVFSPDKLRRMFRPLLECAEHFEKYLDEVTSKGESVNCQEITSKFCVSAIGSCVFGIDVKALYNEGCDFMRMSKRILETSKKICFEQKIKDLMPRLYSFVEPYLKSRDMLNYFNGVIAQALKRGRVENIVGHDFVDLLLEFKDHLKKSSESELSDNHWANIVEKTVEFFIGTLCTVSVTMSHALHEIALNPRIQDKLRDEIKKELVKNEGAITYEALHDMSYLDAVVKETLRKYPAVKYFTKKSLRNYRFTGTKVVIPKGQRVWIPVYAIHRDTNIYPEPEVFDPERFRNGDFESANPMSYLPLGDGSRNCIGAQYAICQMKLGIVKTLQHYKLEVWEKTLISRANESRTCALIPQGEISLKMTKIDRS